jgi:hypothetical protein
MVSVSSQATPSQDSHIPSSVPVSVCVSQVIYSPQVFRLKLYMHLCVPPPTVHNSVWRRLQIKKLVDFLNL